MSKKKAWYVPEIIKVKLNPEQAVLSCCNASVEGQPKPKVGGTGQCAPSKCDGAGMGGDALSS